jgi:hypothetical protein
MIRERIGSPSSADKTEGHREDAEDEGRSADDAGERRGETREVGSKGWIRPKRPGHETRPEGGPDGRQREEQQDEPGDREAGEPVGDRLEGRRRLEHGRLELPADRGNQESRRRQQAGDRDDRDREPPRLAEVDALSVLDQTGVKGPPATCIRRSSGRRCDAEGSPEVTGPTGTLMRSG